MPSPPVETVEVSPAQETTGGKDLAPDDLRALRALFLLLDRWDRNTRLATPVDTQIESGQGERHTQSLCVRQQRIR